METVFFNSDNLVLYYNASNKMVRAVWNGFLSGETMKQAVLQCINILEEKKPVMWLADNRKLKAIRQKDQAWISATLMPHLAVSSLRKLGTLISEDIFSQMAVENLYSKASDITHFDHQYFKTELAALNWLKQESSEASLHY